MGKRTMSLLWAETLNFWNLLSTWTVSNCSKLLSNIQLLLYYDRYYRGWCTCLWLNILWTMLWDRLSMQQVIAQIVVLDEHSLIVETLYFNGSLFCKGLVLHNAGTDTSMLFPYEMGVCSWSSSRCSKLVRLPSTIWTSITRHHCPNCLTQIWVSKRKSQFITTVFVKYVSNSASLTELQR